MDLAGNRRSPTLRVGEAISVPVKDLLDASAQGPSAQGPSAQGPSAQGPSGQDSETVFYVTTPGENERQIKLLESDDDNGASASLMISNAFEPGSYLFRGVTQVPQGDGSGTQVTQTLRVLEVPASESDWRATEAARLQAGCEQGACEGLR